jgi:hypothetical protein
VIEGRDGGDGRPRIHLRYSNFPTAGMSTSRSMWRRDLPASPEPDRK